MLATLTRRLRWSRLGLWLWPAYLVCEPRWLRVRLKAIIGPGSYTVHGTNPFDAGDLLTLDDTAPRWTTGTQRETYGWVGRRPR